MPARFLLLLLTAFCAGACAAPASNERTAAPSDGAAPTPYTADEIRRANAPGTIRVFRIEQAGVPATIQTVHFTGDDGVRATVETTLTDLQGKSLSKPIVAEETWEALRLHASFPTEATTSREATCEVGAGSFECTLYEVRADDQVSKFYFASNEAGPPVLLQVEVGGSLVMKMELMEVTRP